MPAEPAKANGPDYIHHDYPEGVPLKRRERRTHYAD